MKKYSLAKLLSPQMSLPWLWTSSISRICTSQTKEHQTYVEFPPLAHTF